MLTMRAILWSRTGHFLLLLLSMVCSYQHATASKNVQAGISEMVGHYANMLQGHKERPPTKMRVAIVGLPRTGTGSLIEALKVLGYTRLHADEYSEISDLFAALADEKNPLPMDTFVSKVGERGFDAMYYWSYDFVEWAAAVSDDVKIILTVRDTPKKWADSWSSVGESWDTLWFSRPFIWWKPIAQMAPIVQNLFRDIRNDEVGALEKSYSHHIERVKEAVASRHDDKLLIFNAKQGWEPLCQFLGEPCPDPSVPFPHANERYLLQLENNILWVITWIWPVFPLSLIYALWSAFCFIVLRAKYNKQPASGIDKKQS